jgi:L-seryl-tRNA(Ser) seleniumtransferase
LPSVDEVLRSPTAAAAVERFGRPATVTAVRATLAGARQARTTSGAGDVAAAALAQLEADAQPNLRAVFNLTGTVLHTNLGRALIAEEAVEAAVAAMRNAVALEFDLATGKRGERDDHLRGILCELTGAEDATVVNNNAAAVLIVLNTLAKGREAIVSRGELIEIGGAFRMPDIMARAGCTLVEIGATNRTHLRDYEGAIGEKTAMLMKVHPSNYAVVGFTNVVPEKEIAALARSKGLPFVNDLGSGQLVDLERWGLPHEPTVREAIEQGADLVTFSGDKLLGGPQCGIIVGKSELVRRLAKNPLKRALRLDKGRLAALEATLRLYADPDRLPEKLPTLRLLTRATADIESLAKRLLPIVSSALANRATVSIEPCRSQIGSGSLPVDRLASVALSLTPVAPPDGKLSGGAVDRLAAVFRALPVPVIGRVEDGALKFDLRCLEDEAGFTAQLASLPP